ncbi:MAG: hypothetical protein HQL86_06035 [Magnetococcales bacterium]|nr:hypothetical protein [Magnetococcales bacterium]
MTQTGTKANPEQRAGVTSEAKASEEALPIGLKRPVSVSLTRLLTGHPVDEEILDPANPNLMLDRERCDGGA